MMEDHSDASANQRVAGASLAGSLHRPAWSFGASQLLPPAALHSRLPDPALVILDATVHLASPKFDGDYRVVSGYQGWLESHIPGSRHADLLTDLVEPAVSFHFAHPSPEVLSRALRRLGVNDHSVVVLYDREEGFWAARLWWMLYEAGIPAWVLDGGLKAWQRGNAPIERGENCRPVTGKLTECRKIRNVWVDRTEVQAVVEHRAAGTLICALKPEVFRGCAPTRYQRRGHIPGSLNLPARNFLDDRDGYLPAEQLSSQTAGLDQRPGPFLLYCGGGISAALDAFVLTMLGYQEVLIYDGSLEEWSADPALPLEVND